MSSTRKTLPLALAILLFGSVQAQMYKCTDPQDRRDGVFANAMRAIFVVDQIQGMNWQFLIWIGEVREYVMAGGPWTPWIKHEWNEADADRAPAAPQLAGDPTAVGSEGRHHTRGDLI